MKILQVNIFGGGTDSFITKFFENDTFQSVTEQMTKQTQAIAIGLAVFLFLLTLGYNYVKTSIDSVTGDKEGKIVDIKDIIRCIVIIFFISIYSLTLLPAINGTVRTFNKLTLPSTEQQGKLSAAIKEQMEERKAKEKQEVITAANQILNDPKASADDKETAQNIIDHQDPSLWSEISEVFNLDKYIAKFGAWLWGECMNILSSLVKMIVGIISVILFKFLLVIGPLALAVSIVPMFRNQIDIWFGTLINVGLVVTTMHILDCLMYGLINITYSADSFSYEDMHVVNAVNATIVVLYLMSFWLTSKWIGKGDGGRFVSKAVTLATMATMAVAGIAAGAGAKAGGKSGSNVGNIVNTFKNSNKSQQAGDMFKDGE